MDLKDAIRLIDAGVSKTPASWADIGAGTGLFTEALMEVLPGGTLYALDKSPHMLWSLIPGPDFDLRIIEGDFTRPMDIPLVDGILMANALHYAQIPEEVLEKILTNLRPGGSFLLIEYDTEQARPPWIPYPISFSSFTSLCHRVQLSDPCEIGSIPSMYGQARIYSALAYI